LMLASRPLTMPKILGGEARGRKKVGMAIKWDSHVWPTSSSRISINVIDIGIISILP
jgi:hypothetical protein